MSKVRVGKVDPPGTGSLAAVVTVGMVAATWRGLRGALDTLTYGSTCNPSVIAPMIASESVHPSASEICLRVACISSGNRTLTLTLIYNLLVLQIKLYYTSLMGKGYVPVSLTGKNPAKQNAGRVMLQSICEYCGRTTQTWSSKKRFCSQQCANDASNIVIYAHNPSIPQGNKGAIGELQVCVDLLQKGYEVFRSVSAHAAYDLIATKEDVLYRIEVRSASMGRESGKIYVNSYGTGHRDLLALYTPNGVLYLNPDKTPLTFAL